MYKARNLSVLLAISVVIFVLCSSVSTVPAANSFLDRIPAKTDDICNIDPPCTIDTDCAIFSSYYNCLKFRK